MPNRALPQQTQKAYIQICIKSSNLAHKNFNYMPFVKFQYVWVMKLVLDVYHTYNFHDKRVDRENSIDYVSNWIHTFTTVENKYKWKYKDENVIDKTVEVHDQKNLMHLCFKSIKLFCCIFESKRFMFIMNKRSPTPER